MFHPRRGRKGFTLIEMIIVIAIVALLASIIFPAVGNAVTRNAAATNAANLRAVEGQLRTLRLMQPQEFETWITELGGYIGDDTVDLIQSIADLFTDGAATRYEKQIRSLKANAGILTLLKGQTVNTPTSVRMSYQGYSVDQGTQMSVYIGENDLYCHYNGLTKEVFDAIAEGKEPKVPEEEEDKDIFDYIEDVLENLGDVVEDIITDGCVTGDTLVTLADGSRVPIDALTGTEELLVWNHETGALDTAPVAYLIDHGRVEDQKEVITMTFDNGKALKIIGEHVFYDADRSEYVAITTHNAESFLGHHFMALSGTTLEKTRLVSVDRKVELTEYYEIVSRKHMTCFTEDILSACAYLDVLLNPFAIDPDTLAYDKEAMAADLETYGTMDYALLAPFISRDVFDMHNGETVQVSIAKGNLTLADLYRLIELYNTYAG